MIVLKKKIRGHVHHSYYGGLFSGGDNKYNTRYVGKAIWIESETVPDDAERFKTVSEAIGQAQVIFSNTRGIKTEEIE